MQIWELILIALSLSMDAFAVAMCRGVEMRQFNVKHALVIAAFFGGFQAVMPLIGWAIGKQFVDYISAVDHWIAFALLLLIGGKMIFDSFKKEKAEEEHTVEKLNIKQLLVMSVATSIDALAVGVTFAFLETNIWIAVSSIGAIAFVLSLFGVFVGNKIGLKFQNKAEFMGGIVLILIGLKILLEHLGVISF